MNPRRTDRALDGTRDAQNSSCSILICNSTSVGRGEISISNAEEAREI